jgi:hypothetical protein
MGGFLEPQQLQQMLGMQNLAGIGQAIGGAYGLGSDKRPQRVRLEDAKAHYITAIQGYEALIKDVDEALELLDKHPHMARFTDLLKKILG